MMTIINIENHLDTYKDEYFLVEESTGNIYYQYKGEKKVFINSDKDSFDKCLFAYSNFIKNNNYAIIKKYVSDHLLIFSEYSTLEDLD